MWKAIQKYGWENVEHIVVYENLPQGMAEAAEIRLIKEFDSIRNGYNVENGGNVNGTHSEETKRKIAEANRGKIVSDVTRKKLSLNNKGRFGELNYFYGKHHTEKTKAEHAAFMVGNQYNKGKHHTEEFKRWKSEQMHEKYKDGGHPRCKMVAMEKPDGSVEMFYSLRKAADVAGVSPSCMCQHINEEKTLNGCKWRYA